MKALISGAVNIVLTHGHPGNDPTPSEEDIEATKKLFMASKLIGIQLADHLIVSKVGWYSMRAGGILNFEKGGSK